MTDAQKKMLIDNMTDNLPLLRKKLNYTQDDLAEMAGVSRSTIANIESHRNPMTWNMFLALLLLFTKNKEVDKFLNIMGIYTDELNAFLKGQERD